MEYRPEDFLSDDGTLREVWVLGASLVHWRKLLTAALDVKWQTNFWSEFGYSLGDIRGIDDGALKAALFDDATTRPELFFTVRNVRFRCYFFYLEAIEFTFDPSSVESIGDFEAVREFMRWLGDVCDGRVIMTWETDYPVTLPAVLEYLPER